MKQFEIKISNSEVNYEEAVMYMESRVDGIINNKSEMSFYSWGPNEPLTINKYGILEPLKGKKITPSTLIIPMLAFDSHLNRLGYGGGFYDRFIQKIEKQNNCVKIGLALSCQKINKVPVDKHDKKMDFIITEKRIYK